MSPTNYAQQSSLDPLDCDSGAQGVGIWDVHVVDAARLQQTTVSGGLGVFARFYYGDLGSHLQRVLQTAIAEASDGGARFDQTLRFSVPSGEQCLLCEVFSAHQRGKDDLLGATQIPLDPVAGSGGGPSEYRLRRGPGGATAGVIRLDLEYHGPLPRGTGGSWQAAPLGADGETLAGDTSAKLPDGRRRTVVGKQRKAILQLLPPMRCGEDPPPWGGGRRAEEGPAMPALLPGAAEDRCKRKREEDPEPACPSAFKRYDGGEGGASELLKRARPGGAARLVPPPSPASAATMLKPTRVASAEGSSSVGPSGGDGGDSAGQEAGSPPKLFGTILRQDCHPDAAAALKQAHFSPGTAFQDGHIFNFNAGTAAPHAGDVDQPGGPGPVEAPPPAAPVALAPPPAAKPGAVKATQRQILPHWMTFVTKTVQRLQERGFSGSLRKGGEGGSAAEGAAQAGPGLDRQQQQPQQLAPLQEAPPSASVSWRSESNSDTSSTSARLISNLLLSAHHVHGGRATCPPQGRAGQPVLLPGVLVPSQLAPPTPLPHGGAPSPQPPFGMIPDVPHGGGLRLPAPWLPPGAAGPTMSAPAISLPILGVKAEEGPKGSGFQVAGGLPPQEAPLAADNASYLQQQAAILWKASQVMMKDPQVATSDVSVALARAQALQQEAAMWQASIVLPQTKAEALWQHAGRTGVVSHERVDAIRRLLAFKDGKLLQSLMSLDDGDLGEGDREERRRQCWREFWEKYEAQRTSCLHAAPSGGAGGSGRPVTVHYGSHPFY